MMVAQEDRPRVHGPLGAVRLLQTPLDEGGAWLGTAVGVRSCVPGVLHTEMMLRYTGNRQPRVFLVSFLPSSGLGNNRPSILMLSSTCRALPIRSKSRNTARIAC